MAFVFQLIASLCLSFITAVIVIPMSLKMAHKNDWYDDVDERKIHTTDTPHIGGVGLFVASTIGFMFSYILNVLFFNLSLAPITRVHPLLASFLILHVTGIIDDFAHLRARHKFLLQLAAATMLVAIGFAITSIEIPSSYTTIHLGIAGYFITILWLTGISNAINFIDGMDGLSGGCASIAALTYGVTFLLIGSHTSALISFAVFGALAGFLIFNWPPAKIFMGDSGSLFLGFAVGSIPLLEHSGSSSLFIVSLLLSVALFPVLDTFTAILRRLRRRVAIIMPDKEHIHHKLLDLGLSQHQILAITYCLEVLPCAAIIVWAATGNDSFFWLVLATWIIMLAFFIILDVVYHRKERPLPESVSGS